MSSVNVMGTHCFVKAATGLARTFPTISRACDPMMHESQPQEYLSHMSVYRVRVGWRIQMFCVNLYEFSYFRNIIDRSLSMAV